MKIEGELAWTHNSSIVQILQSENDLKLNHYILAMVHFREFTDIHKCFTIPTCFYRTSTVLCIYETELNAAGRETLDKPTPRRDSQEDSTSTMTTITEIVNCNCPDCKNPLDYYLQAPLHPKSTRPSYWIGTCRTVGCTLNSVTLSDSEWSNLVTDAELMGKYRAMVAQMAGAK